MSSGNVPSGHQFSSLKSLGSPYNLAMARERVYRCPGQRFADFKVNQPFGGGSVMVWGALLFNDPTSLYVTDGNLNRNRYLQEVIHPSVIPELQRIGAAAMFQDDNDQTHRARVVTDFLWQHNVNRMDWPPYSPDLNPIEHALTMPHPPILHIWPVCLWQSGRQYHRLSFKDW